MVGDFHRPDGRIGAFKGWRRESPGLGMCAADGIGSVSDDGQARGDLVVLV
jgi:hypothetical protein